MMIIQEVVDLHQGQIILGRPLTSKNTIPSILKMEISVNKTGTLQVSSTIKMSNKLTKVGN